MSLCLETGFESSQRKDSRPGKAPGDRKEQAEFLSDHLQNASDDFKTNKADKTSAHISIAIDREGSPRRFNEYVHIYTTEQSNSPAASLYLYGQVAGEVALSPEALYWSITDVAMPVAERPEALITQRVTIRSATGRPLALKNPQSTIAGIKLELATREAGKVYELIARLAVVPTNTISGNVSFETSIAAQPRIEVPVIVNVFKP